MTKVPNITEVTGRIFHDLIKIPVLNVSIQTNIVIIESVDDVTFK